MKTMLDLPDDDWYARYRTEYRALMQQFRNQMENARRLR